MSQTRASGESSSTSQDNKIENDAELKKLCLGLKAFLKNNKLLLDQIIPADDLTDMQTYVERAQEVNNTSVPLTIDKLPAYHNQILQLINPLLPIARTIAKAVRGHLNSKTQRLSPFQKTQLNTVLEHINTLENQVAREIAIAISIEEDLQEVHEFADKITVWEKMLLFPNGDLQTNVLNLKTKLQNFIKTHQKLWEGIPLTLPVDPGATKVELPSIKELNKQIEHLLIFTNDVSLVTNKTREAAFTYLEAVSNAIVVFAQKLRETAVLVEKNIAVNPAPLSAKQQLALTKKLRYLDDNIIQPSSLSPEAKLKSYDNFFELSRQCHDPKPKINLYETYKQLSLQALKIRLEELQDSLAGIHAYYAHEGELFSHAKALRHKLKKIIKNGKNLWQDLIPGEVLLPLVELQELETWAFVAEKRLQPEGWLQPKGWLLQPEAFFKASLINQKRFYRIQLRKLDHKIANFEDRMQRYILTSLAENPDETITPIDAELRKELDNTRMSLLSEIISYADIEAHEKEKMLIEGCGGLGVLLETDQPKVDFYKEYQKLSIEAINYKFKELTAHREHLEAYFNADAVEILQEWKGLLYALRLTISQPEHIDIAYLEDLRRVKLLPDTKTEPKFQQWGWKTTEELVQALQNCHDTCQAIDTMLHYRAKAALIDLLRYKYENIKAWLAYSKLRANAVSYIDAEITAKLAEEAVYSAPDIIKSMADQKFYAGVNQKLSAIVFIVEKYRAKLQKFVAQATGRDESYEIGEQLLGKLTVVAEQLTDPKLNFAAKKKTLRLLLGAFVAAIHARTGNVKRIPGFAVEDDVKLAELKQHNWSTQLMMYFGHLTIKDILLEFINNEAKSISAWLDELRANEVQAELNKSPELVLSYDAYLKVYSDVFFTYFDKVNNATPPAMLDDLDKLQQQIIYESEFARYDNVNARNIALARFKEIQEKELPVLLAMLNSDPGNSQAENDTLELLRERVQHFSRTLQSNTIDLGIKIVDAGSLAAFSKVVSPAKALQIQTESIEDSEELDAIVADLNAQLSRDVAPLIKFKKGADQEALENIINIVKECIDRINILNLNVNAPPNGMVKKLFIKKLAEDLNELLVMCNDENKTFVEKDCFLTDFLKVHNELLAIIPPLPSIKEQSSSDSSDDDEKLPQDEIENPKNSDLKIEGQFFRKQFAKIAAIPLRAIYENQALSQTIQTMQFPDMYANAVMNVSTTLLRYVRELHGYLENKLHLNEDNFIAKALKSYLIIAQRKVDTTKSLLAEVANIQKTVNKMNLRNHFALVDQDMQLPKDAPAQKMVHPQCIPPAYIAKCEEIARVGDEVRNLFQGHKVLAESYGKSLLTIVGRYKAVAKTGAATASIAIEQKTLDRSLSLQP